MRWEVVGWGALALVLFAAEALVPGAFMLWIGIGAAAVFVLVAVFADIPLLWQVVAFVLLSVVSIQWYRRWGRSHARQSDKPLLNRRAEQLIGRVVVVDQDIVAGMPKSRAAMHLDTVFSFCDRDLVTVFPEVVNQIIPFTLRLGMNWPLGKWISKSPNTAKPCCWWTTNPPCACCLPMYWANWATP